MATSACTHSNITDRAQALLAGVVSFFQPWRVPESMVETLASAEPYRTQFSGTVRSADGCKIVLEETYFYAESGGQPADRGTLAGEQVIDVQERDERVIHVLAESPAVTEGAVVEGDIDADFRTYCMRAHTASHALYGAGRQLFSELGYGGFDIGKEKVRVDFATPTSIDDETLTELERLVNRAVWDSRAVTWKELPREEALSREEIAFNTKTKEGIAGDTVRVVDIDGWDSAACGGTHVENTREIGPVSVLGRENPGEGLTRVEFAVGPAGIAHRMREKTAVLAAAAEAETSVAELAETVTHLRDERDALATERDALRNRLVEQRLSELREEIVERDGREWLVGVVDGLDANELAERAGELTGESADVVALVNDGGKYVGVATVGESNASRVVEEITAEFGGGGGGSERVAQGGGLDADAESVVTYLRDESESTL
jgi:alanyl-tRNA synthetase